MRHRLSTILLFGLPLLLVVAAALYFWPRIPGSFYRDANGNPTAQGA